MNAAVIDTFVVYYLTSYVDFMCIEITIFRVMIVILAIIK